MASATASRNNLALTQVFCFGGHYLKATLTIGARLESMIREWNEGEIG